MAGIYVHIPFCKKACHYCNFHFSTTHSLLPQMVKAIAQEMELQASLAYIHEPIETIYLGGGTPSLLNHEQLQLLFTQIHRYFTVTPHAEITLEANPDDINHLQLEHWKAVGINRLSIGIQSFQEADLRWMNRAHTATQAVDCVTLAQQADITNISIDLMYGLPGATNQHWLQNIEQALALQVPHISAYALTVEEKTALHKMIEKGKISPVYDEHQAEQFHLLVNTLESNGWEHYEISNFCKPGRHSQHNSNYWKGVHYVGFGPSAHSFNGVSRQWNIANNALYITAIENNQLPYEIEILTPLQQLNEYIMTSLRTSQGIQFSHISTNFGQPFNEKLLHAVAPFIQQGLVQKTDNGIQLTQRGKFFADGIAAALFQ
jgi:oxygen-independent coproporphyrinogen III oxidase